MQRCWSVDSDEKGAEGDPDHSRMSVSKSGVSVQISVYAAEGTTLFQIIY